MSNGLKRYTGMPSSHRVDQKLSLQIPQKKMAFRRVSLCFFQKGSLTMEAAMVLPLVLCSITALLYLFTFTAIQAEAYRRQSECAELLAVTSCQEQQEDPYVSLELPQIWKLPFPHLFAGGQVTVHQTVVRAWVGYTGESFQKGASEEMVYLTPEGEVCHRNRNCSYLRLSIRRISYAEVDKARNRSGEKYAACEYCMKGSGTGMVLYITDYGNRYHSDQSCQGLKRTIMAVPWSEAGGRPLCSGCGGT